MDKILSIFTSYWANPLLKDLDAIYIGISRSVPRWLVSFEYRHLSLLAPPAGQACTIENEEKFAAAYRKQLNELGAERIVVTAFSKPRHKILDTSVHYRWQDNRRLNLHHRS
jgi:hypothetical protein